MVNRPQPKIIGKRLTFNSKISGQPRQILVHIFQDYQGADLFPFHSLIGSREMSAMIVVSAHHGKPMLETALTNYEKAMGAVDKNGEPTQYYKGNVERTTPKIASKKGEKRMVFKDEPDVSILI